jgi:hypothetical protein
MFQTTNFGWHIEHSGQVGIEALLAVRDSDGIIYRVAYNLIASGEMVKHPTFPGGE